MTAATTTASEHTAMGRLNSAKGKVVPLMRWGKEGIRANAVAPGP